MNFTGIKARVLRRGGLALCVALAALSGCGGGSRKVDFQPTRIVAFGDESSLINSDGTKYSINGYNATATVLARDCTLYPIWVQYLASTFGLAFTTCPGTLTPGSAAASSFTVAKVGNTAAGVVADLNGYLTGGANGHAAADHDLVTVLVGQQDVLDAYTRLGASAASSAVDLEVAAIQSQALALALKINQVAQSGPPVIVSTIPNVALTPFGRAQTASGNAILSRLSQAYNDKLTLSLLNDGHLIGLVNGEIEIQNMSSTSQKDDTNGYGIPKGLVGLAACTPADTPSLLSCIGDGTTVYSATTNNLVQTSANSGVTQPATSYIWAGDYQLAPTAHARLGYIAESRAKNNPF